LAQAYTGIKLGTELSFINFCDSNLH